MGNRRVHIVTEREGVGIARERDTSGSNLKTG